MELAQGIQLQTLVKLRKQLHQTAELSGDEKNTAATIRDFLFANNPDRIIENLGGHGLAAVYEGANPGPAVMFRCELDALPIEELNHFPHRSASQRVSHKCGHDGHMAIVAGLSNVLEIHPPEKGRVILLFQPAEETGEGAEKIINDPKFAEIVPDYAFALHNLPGYPLNQIILKENIFASASSGIMVSLEGKTSHASEPEKGISPALALSEIIGSINDLNNNKGYFSDFSLVTIIYARLGEKAFGTSPGSAEIFCTIRSYENNDLKKMGNKIHKIVEQITQFHNLKFKINHTEEFPSTENDPELVQLLSELAGENKLQTVDVDYPFRWSEDFGHFTSKHKGVLFGLGAGAKQPALHHPDYDFPDDIIPAGIQIFNSVINTFNR